MSTHARFSLILAGLLAAACCWSQPQKTSKEQAALTAQAERLSSAMAALGVGSDADRLRLDTELDLAQARWQLARTAAAMELATHCAAATTGLQADPERNGPQTRGAMAQELSQAIQVYLQAVSQATQTLMQKRSEILQASSQAVSTDLQTMMQSVSTANQSFMQALSAPDLGPGLGFIETAFPAFGSPVAPGDKDPATVCRAEIQAAREAYAKALKEATDATAAEQHQAIAAGANDATKLRDALTKSTKRFQIGAFGAFDTMDIAVKAALRKYALAVVG